MWVAFLFAAVVALNQTWARELRNQVLDAYRVSPAPANALFLAKALGNFIFVSVLEALMTPLFVIFYNLRVLGPAWQLIPVALLGTWALVVNGTFFAAMSLRTRSREIMLPLLLFPISIPAVIAMVAATTAILTGEDSAHFYIVLLLTYDVVFTTACLALFENDSARGMKRLFPILAVLTAVLSGVRAVPGAGGCAHRCAAGDVYRIIYYHVPSAWTAFLLFFINFIASIQYLAQRKAAATQGCREVDCDRGRRGGRDCNLSSAVQAYDSRGNAPERGCDDSAGDSGVLFSDRRLVSRTEIGSICWR